MNDSNCNCCACQYSTPPWWVTMGFTPPNNYGAPHTQYTPPPATGGTVAPHPVTVAPPATHNPATGLGGLVSGVGNAVGGAITNPIGTVGTVVGEVIKGLGSVLGSIF